jgi:LCP family protein required for cell wall assembly
VADDEGFGPPARGGGRSRTATPGTKGSTRAEDDFGPALKGRGRRRWGRGLAKLTLILLLVLALAVVGTGTALAIYTNAQIERTDVDGVRRGGPHMNVLLVGSDSREGLTREERNELRLGHEVTGVRTDTILLLSVAGDRAAMLSFPRDLLVTMCDGRQGRINAAYSVGGPSCLVETVTQLSGIPINTYMEVDFFGFVDLVDAVGGVSIYMEEPIDDPKAGLDVDAGCQRLDGRQALGYVRTRAGPQGDLGRIARQQRFIRELIKEIADPATLVDVPRLFQTAGAGARSLTASRGFGPVDMFRLARAARGLAGGSSETYAVPASPQTVGGAAVLVADQPDAEELFGQFRDGSILGVDADLEPGDVSVAVLNGAGISGLAGEGREHLESRGFTVTEVGNTTPVQRTVVRFTRGNEAAARLVADHVPGAVTEQAADGPAVALVLGPDAELGAEPEPEPEDDEPAPEEEEEEEEDPDRAIGAGAPPDDC